MPTPVELLTYVAEAQQPPAYQGVDGSSSGPPEPAQLRGDAALRGVVSPF